MSKVFLSYSRGDTQFVDQLTSELEQQGIDVWVDRQDIEGGEAWRAAITQAVRECSAFLLILSPNSTGSKNVSRELALAETHDRLIIPIIHQKCDIPAGMEYQLAELQWINFTLLTHEEGLKRLVRVLPKSGAAQEPDEPSRQQIEKRRGDTARLRQFLEQEAAQSSAASVEPLGQAVDADPPPPIVKPPIETAVKAAAGQPATFSAQANVEPSQSGGTKSRTILIAAAGIILLGAGGAYAVFRPTKPDNVTATPAVTATPTVAPTPAAIAENPAPTQAPIAENPAPTQAAAKPTQKPSDAAGATRPTPDNKPAPALPSSTGYTNWMPAAEAFAYFRNRPEAEKNESYLSKAEGRNQNGQSQFRLYFAPRTPGPRGLTYLLNQTQAQFEAVESKNAAQGLTCISRQTFTDSNGVTRYQGVWVKM